MSEVFTNSEFCLLTFLSIFEARENLSNNNNSMSCQTICNECAFHVETESGIECIHPDELAVNCAIVTFCSSFQPAEEIDSPCVTFGQEE
ncbi:hypothetical protein H6G80_16115 [Nostoc sp. FACHB-87]|nr:hypothetical protein [Nostoc sp. FACHB-87]